MDLDGNELFGEQLGLLLYKGGTVCDHAQFNFTAADAICRQMNYTYAARFTSNEHYFNNQDDYEIALGNIVCSSNEWEGCTFSEKPDCDHLSDIFLSCSGNFIAFSVHCGGICDIPISLFTA